MKWLMLLLLIGVNTYAKGYLWTLDVVKYDKEFGSIVTERDTIQTEYLLERKDGCVTAFIVDHVKTYCSRDGYVMYILKKEKINE